MTASSASLLQKVFQEVISQPSSPVASDPSTPAFANPAVARCAQAYVSTIQTGKSQKKELYQYSSDAKAAYCNMMPPLSGPRNIRDFIACTAHGMLIGSIDRDDATRLLYAAQVAYGAHNIKSQKKSKSSAKTGTKPPENGHISHPVSSPTQAQ
jgi:hypothetical protein